MLYKWLRVGLFKALFTKWDSFIIGNIPITRGMALDANAVVIVYNFVVAVVFKMVHKSPVIGSS